MLRPLVLASTVALLAVPAHAQQRLTEHTLRLASGQASRPATIDRSGREHRARV